MTSEWMLGDCWGAGSVSSGYGPMVTSCEHSDEPSGSGIIELVYTQGIFFFTL
jgi:hypothetical protein